MSIYSSCNIKYREEANMKKVKETPDMTREKTVSMTIHVPLLIHTRMRLEAVKRNKRLYQMIIELFDEEF
jgi:hypothetical protein